MGGATSKTSADIITSQLMSVVSELSANAYQITQNANTVNLSGNCVIKPGAEINQLINVSIKSDILQSILNSTDTENKLNNTVKQISEAEAPNLSLAKGAESEAFTTLINNLSTEIKNSVGTSCAQSNTSLNEFNCTDNAVFAGKSNQEIIGNYLLKCTQNISSVTLAKQQLQNFIDQHSSAKVEDVIVKILIAIAIIMLIFYLGPGLGKILSKYSSNKTEKSETTETSDQNKTKLIIAIISLIAIIVGVVLFYFFVITPDNKTIQRI